MKSIDTFCAGMHTLFAETLDDEERWNRVEPLLQTLLADPELIASAANWPVSERATNLLLHEDRDYGFVINALIKEPGGSTHIHDHAHTWTAYGLIDGVEKVLRYEVISEEGDQAVLEAAGEHLVQPGYVDIVHPYHPHAEIAESRTVAVIIRSERLGTFPQRIFDLETGQIRRIPGPTAIPYELVV